MKVVCTNGVKSVLLELVPAFERAKGSKVDVAWGATNGLLQELDAGADADLAILTAEAIDALIGRGKVAAGGRVDLARSGIGVAVRRGTAKPDIGSPDGPTR